VQAWSARFKSKSDRSGSNPATDTGQELSTEEAIEFAQLMGALSRNAGDTAAVLDVLVPLLDERYILPKTANTVSAGVGVVVAAAVALLWWNPLGWAAASCVAAHSTVSTVAIVSGGVTAVFCGHKGNIGRDQRKLVDEGALISQA
jgi:uncharacterized membrane protein